MTWNTSVDKQTIFLGRAGNDEYNPLLSGLPLDVQVEFSQNVHSVSGLVGAESPPTTPIAFTQDPSDLRVFRHSAVAGVAPFDTGDAFTFLRILFTSQLTGDVTYWDKKFYIAALPSDAVQVYDVDAGWLNVNYDTLPGVVPNCAQQCPVRFMQSWYDEFRVLGYGGAERVSVYDYGSAETDTINREVRRDTDERIEPYSYVYLAKHVVNTVEQHDFTVKFKSVDGVADGVEVRVRVNSLPCWGFEIRDPITS